MISDHWKNKKVIFKNKTWILAWYLDRPASIHIENRETGLSDSAIHYSNGRVGFGRPEMIPNYIKNKVISAFKKRF